jgi:hypothetical protein
LFFLPFTWGRHRRACATTALPRATSLELLILFDTTMQMCIIKATGPSDYCLWTDFETVDKSTDIYDPPVGTNIYNLSTYINI